ncbi:hypothetical protein JMUB7513_27810 [Staphylococcus aureus]
MLFTTNYNWTFLILFTIFFVIFIKHISRVSNPFINPKLGKNIPFMLGLFSGGLIFSIVAGFISMVPYICLLYTSPSPRDYAASRMPSSA